MNQPKTFEELRLIIDQVKNTPLRLRLTNDEKNYQAIAKTSKVQNYINRIRETVSKEKFIMIESSFPYTWLLEFLPNVMHKIFWFNGDIDELKKYLNKLNNNKIEYCFFQNNPNRRSVSDIPHYHFFILG